MNCVWCRPPWSPEGPEGQLARCVFEMDLLRRVLLSKCSTFGGAPGQQQPGCIPLLTYPVCLRRAVRHCRVNAGFAALAGLDIVAVACAALSIALCLNGVVLAHVTCWWAVCRLNPCPCVCVRACVRGVCRPWRLLMHNAGEVCVTWR
jgi:hypothetical protein